MFGVPSESPGRPGWICWFGRGKKGDGVGDRIAVCHGGRRWSGGRGGSAECVLGRVMRSVEE